MVTDPIADMLTRLRNAGQARHRRVDMPVSNLKIHLASQHKKKHYNQHYNQHKESKQPQHNLNQKNNQ